MFGLARVGTEFGRLGFALELDAAVDAGVRVALTLARWAATVVKLVFASGLTKDTVSGELIKGRPAATTNDCHRSWKVSTHCPNVPGASTLAIIRFQRFYRGSAASR